jgi:hypothetical protein
MTLSKQHSIKVCHYAKCRNLFIVMLNVIILSVNIDVECCYPECHYVECRSSIESTMSDEHQCEIFVNNTPPPTNELLFTKL